MKRLNVLLQVLLGLGLVTQAHSAQISLIPDTTYSQRDTFVTVSVVADAAVQYVKALELDIDVTPTVIYADTLYIGLGSFFVGDPDSTFFHIYLSPAKDRLTLDFAVLGDGKTRSGPGVLAQIRYKTVGFGETGIVIGSYKLRDSLNQPMQASLQNAWLKVCRYVGDINGDNRIDLGDLSYMVAYLTLGAPVPVPYASGNVNCLGIIDLSDLSLLVAYLTQSTPLCKRCL